MDNDRKPVKHRSSAGRRLKRAIKSLRRQDSVPLKVIARELVDGSHGDELATMARDWFFNKSANVSNLPLKIGSTRKKKGQQGKR